MYPSTRWQCFSFLEQVILCCIWNYLMLIKSNMFTCGKQCYFGISSAVWRNRKKQDKTRVRSLTKTHENQILDLLSLFWKSVWHGRLQAVCPSVCSSLLPERLKTVHITLTFLLDIEVSLHSPLARGLLVLICRSNSLHQHFYFLLGAQKVVSCLHPTRKHTYANRSWEPYLNNANAILK